MLYLAVCCVLTQHASGEAGLALAFLKAYYIYVQQFTRYYIYIYKPA